MRGVMAEDIAEGGEGEGLEKGGEYVGGMAEVMVLGEVVEEG